MTCNAVVLTRLEWDRLVSCGWLRLHNARLTRVDDWSLSSAQLNFDTLMKSAPDVGTSSSDYVLAELRYEVWPLIATHDFQLGRMLKLDQVQHFLCFDERACQVLNTTYSGPIKYTVQLFQAAQLWIDWRERIFRASEDNRAARLLEHFGLPSPFEEFKQKSALFFDRLSDTQRGLSGIKHYEHAKGTRAFGWIVALAISKKNYTTEAGSNVKSMVKELQSEYSVDVPFFMGKSEGVANAVLSDPQYKEVYDTLVVCAAYVHYTYLVERSSYKKFGYNAFCQDIEWLKKQHINLAAQLVEKTACYMSDELLSRVLSQNLKIPAKNSVSLEGNALTAGAPSTVTSEAPDIAPNLEDVGEEKATPALPLPSSVSSASSEPEKPLAQPVADSTGGCDPNKPDMAETAVAIPQDQCTTKVNADAASAPVSPEEHSVPNAAEAKLAPSEPDLFPQNEDLSKIPATEAGGTSTTAPKKPHKNFNLADRQGILKKIHAQGASKQALKQVCQEYGLTQKEVKSWAKELDPDLAKRLG